MINYKDMTATEKKAYKNFKYAAKQLIGGLENTYNDSMPGSESREWAGSLLYDDSKLLETVYKDGTTTLCGDGFTCWDPRTVTTFLREINFLGSDRLHQLAGQALDKVLEDGICLID